MKQLFDLDATPVEVRASLGDELLGQALGLHEMRVAVILVNGWEHLRTRLRARSPGDKHLGEVWGGIVHDRESQTCLSLLGQHASDSGGTHIVGDENSAGGNDAPVQEGRADLTLAGVSKATVRVTRTDIAQPVDGDAKAKLPPSER